jgi:hypothetical protein
MVKAMIDEDGKLLLCRIRSGQERISTTGCPFAETFCGDWCVLFGEPKDGILEICHAKFKIDIDKRIKSGE